MSSIRAIFTVGTIVLAGTVLQSQATAQTAGAPTDPTAATSRNPAFFGYTGFIGDERTDAIIPHEPAASIPGETAATVPDGVVDVPIPDDTDMTIPIGVDGTIPDGLFPDEPSKFGFVQYVQDEATNVPTPEIPDSDAVDVADPHSPSCYGPYLHDPWVTFEYMHAWARGRWLPPLVTTGGVNGKLPGASVLFGNEYVGTGLQAAGRISAGAWLDDEQCLGVGGRFFAIEGDSSGISRVSDVFGNPVTARPFADTNPLIALPPPFKSNSFVVTGPGLRRGSLLVTAENDVLGADAYLRYTVHRRRNRRVDLLLGYQFTRIDDALRISHDTTQILLFPGREFHFVDLFDVQNEFHGVELGLQSEMDHGPFTLSLMGKLGMGNMRETVTVFGSTRQVDGVITTDFVGGLLAQPTNMGTHIRDDFAIIPEAEFKVICRITKQIEASIGYSLLYWSDVALAGKQIDLTYGNQPTLNSAQLLTSVPPPVGDPQNPVFRGPLDTDFWLQALSIGITFKH